MKRGLLLLLVGAAATPVAFASIPALAQPTPQSSATAATSGPTRALPSSTVSPSTPPPAPPFACSLETRQGTHANLRFDAAGAVFAHVYASRARFDLPEGDPWRGASAAIEVTPSRGQGGARLRGIIAPRDIALHVRRAQVIAGFVVPRTFAALAWWGGRAGALDLALPPPTWLRLDAPATALRLTLGCADVALSPSEVPFDPFASIGGPGLAHEVVLTRRVPLAVTPGGAKVAELEPDDIGGTVTVLEERGAHARIAVDGGDVVAFGWIAKNAVRAPEPGEGGLGLSGIGQGGGAAAPLVACARELPLAVTMAGQRRIVGSVLPWTPLRVRERDGDDARIVFWSLTLGAANGAEFVVKARDLEGCPGVKNDGALSR